MLNRRARGSLRNRALQDSGLVGDVGLAFLMAAGVASCGGIQGGVDAGGRDGESDGSVDDQRHAVEAAQLDGGVAEANVVDGEGHPEASGCPASKPTAGAACTEEGLGCNYSPPGSPCGVFTRCMGGVWVEHADGC
jgi:hypothetical protein